MAEMQETYTVLVGLDWADQQHDLHCLYAGQSAPVHEVVPSSPEGLRGWVDKLRARFPEGRVAVCLEQSRGPVAYELATYEFVDLYPVNPLTLKRYRESFCTSGAKDDPGDSALLLDLLRKHPEALRRLTPDDAATRELRLLCEYRRKAVDQRTRLCNELRAALKQYYPQALELVGDSLYADMACALLMKWPRFTDIAAVKPAVLRQFYHGQNARSQALLADRLHLVTSSCPLTTDRAVVEPCVLRVHQLVGEIRSLNRSVEAFEHRLKTLYADHPDAFIFSSLPAAGAQMAPRLLAVFGSDRSRYQNATEVATFVGVAPVIETSGKQRWVHWRWHCPKFLRQSVVEFAAKTITVCSWAARYYHKQRDKGKDHQAAVRALAFKWIRIIFRCWQDRTPYDETRYVASLARHGSWLAEIPAGAVTNEQVTA